MIQSSQGKQKALPVKTQLPPAVLVGLDSMQGLPAARVLARHGIPVIGIAAHPHNSQTKTNVCREIRFAPTAEPSLIDHLIELGKSLPEKSVRFPCQKHFTSHPMTNWKSQLVNSLTHVFSNLGTVPLIAGKAYR